ncbi:serine protease [Patescibacteria group bacterium]|nr:serine protease [Patescibacteria group bacterium]
MIRAASLLLVFCLGAAGGLWAQAFVLPYLATHEPFEGWGFVEEWNRRITVVRPIEQIIVREGEGMERVLEQAQRTAVGVRSTVGVAILEGSGIIATSDGLVVTLATLVPPGSAQTVYVEGGIESAQVLKRDLQKNLALLKLDRSGLRTAEFSREEEVRLGTTLFLAGKIMEEDEVFSVANAGVVKSLSKEALRTSMMDTTLLNGSPLFTIEGRIAGMAIVSPDGTVRAISASVLRSFLGL